jgi:hypothetical protein
MNESSKIELDRRVRLYQFYVDCFIKGIGIFLGITAALLKFALDSTTHRTLFSRAGLSCSLVILIPLVFGFVEQRWIAADLSRLAGETHTSIISTAPLLMLCFTTLSFWLIICGGWIYILGFMTMTEQAVGK